MNEGKEKEIVYFNDGNKDHTYREKANDFKDYYGDKESDFSFRENLIRSIFLSQFAKLNLRNPSDSGEINNIADKSIEVADILLEKMYNNVSMKG